MKHYQIIIAILAVAVSFVSCSSSGDDETVEQYTQHEKPQWNNAVEEVKPDEKYPTDLTAYIQLPGSISAYSSNADEMAAFCGDECRGNGTLVDNVWCIRIWGNVGDKITLRFYCYEPNRYMYHSTETIVLKDDERLGTFDDPLVINFDVDK